MRTIWLIPISASLLLGAGCALSSKEAEKATVESVVDSIPAPVVIESPKEESVIIPPAPQAQSPQLQPPSLPRIVPMAFGNFFFTPSTISAKSGEQLTLQFSGESGYHTFAIDELSLDAQISNGTTLTVTAPTVPGRYAYYCSVGPHRTLGMEGILVVE